MSSAVVVGATSGVGRALVERLARSGYGLMLVARDARDLAATAADIRLRFGTECQYMARDIGDPTWDVTAFVDECYALFGNVERVLVPAGSIAGDDEGSNPDVIASLLATNYLGPARLGATFGRAMAKAGGGSIVLFSSIAAVAPRSKNAAYSAAKAALETYAKALRHDLEPKGVQVLLLALGYVDTPLSFGMRLALPVARPESVADYIVDRALATGKHHYPAFWWGVTTTLRHLPWALYRRLSF